MDRKVMINWINAGTLPIPMKLLQHYKGLRLTETEAMLLIHVHSFLQCGVNFPTPDMLSERMSIEKMECMELLGSLVKRGFLQLVGENDEHNNKSEYFSLDPLWDKLLCETSNHTENEREVRKEVDEKMIYELFEKEFARPLSPLECEQITMWIDQDQYSPPLIKAALMEGVIGGKLNLRYIDRILMEWYKNGIRTVQQAKEYGERWRNNQTKFQQQPTKGQKEHPHPHYDWLRS